METIVQDVAPTRSRSRQGALAHRTLGRSFLLRWVGASIAGWIAGFMVSFMTLWFALQAVTGDADAFLDGGTVAGNVTFGVLLTVAYAVGGAGFGAGQWLLLRRVSVPSSWVTRTAAGFAVLAAIFVTLEAVVPQVVNIVVHALAGGTVAGLLQVKLLAGRIDPPRRWVVSTAIAFLAGSLTDLAAYTFITGGDHSLSGIAGMAVIAVVLGATLIGPLRRTAAAAA